MGKIIEAIEIIRMYYHHCLNEATDADIVIELRDHKPDFEWTMEELQRIAEEEHNGTG